MGKSPYIALYVGDWLRDDISGCSLEAQGLWLRLMFIMHDAERYGYLAKNGTPIPPESIARKCGCTPEQYVTLLDELDRAGIPRRSSEGVIYSARMVRDEKERILARERKRRQRIPDADDATRHGSVTPMSRQSHAVTSVSTSASSKVTKVTLSKISGLPPAQHQQAIDVMTWVQGQSPEYYQHERALQQQLEKWIRLVDGFENVWAAFQAQNTTQSPGLKSFREHLEHYAKKKRAA